MHITTHGVLLDCPVTCEQAGLIVEAILSLGVKADFTGKERMSLSAGIGHASEMADMGIYESNAGFGSLPSVFSTFLFLKPTCIYLSIYSLP